MTEVDCVENSEHGHGLSRVMHFDHSDKSLKLRPRLTRRQISLIASSPCVNNVRIARKDAILTLSPAEDHKSRRT